MRNHRFQREHTGSIAAFGKLFERTPDVTIALGLDRTELMRITCMEHIDVPKPSDQGNIVGEA